MKIEWFPRGSQREVKEVAASLLRMTLAWYMAEQSVGRLSGHVDSPKIDVLKSPVKKKVEENSRGKDVLESTERAENMRPAIGQLPE